MGLAPLGNCPMLLQQMWFHLHDLLWLCQHPYLLLVHGMDLQVPQMYPPQVATEIRQLLIRSLFLHEILMQKFIHGKSWLDSAKVSYIRTYYQRYQFILYGSKGISNITSFRKVHSSIEILWNVSSYEEMQSKIE